MLKFWKKGAKNKHHSEFLVAQKLKINVARLKELLGGDENILNSEYRGLKVKVFVRSSNKIETNKIKSLRGITGLLIGRQHITIIVGNQARELANLIVKTEKG